MLLQVYGLPFSTLLLPCICSRRNAWNAQAEGRKSSNDIHLSLRPVNLSATNKPKPTQSGTNIPRWTASIVRKHNAGQAPDSWYRSLGGPFYISEGWEVYERRDSTLCGPILSTDGVLPSEGTFEKVRRRVTTALSTLVPITMHSAGCAANLCDNTPAQGRWRTGALGQWCE